MTEQPTPETDAKLADDTQPSSDSPDYVRALEIHIHLLRAELADERAKKSDALIAAVNDIERLTAERDALKEDEFFKPELDIANARLRCEVDPRDNGFLEPGVILPSQLRADVARLRAALELIAAPMRPDGTYNRDRAACGSIARAALATSAK